MISRVRSLAPLLLVVAAQAAWCGYLSASHRVPAGHDGFQYFYLKYYFFNDYIRHGEVAQWLPYLAHGTPAVWWYMLNGGIFDPVVMTIARILGLRDFFPIFYTLLFAEQALLAAGTWLLAREHLTSRAAVFAVTASVVGASVWTTQPFWNYHAIVAVPLMLWYVRRTVLVFAWHWPAWLLLLLFLQTFGHASYYLPMTLLGIAVYAAALLASPASRRALRDRFAWSLPGVLVVAAAGAALGVELLWLKSASGTLSFGASQRGASGFVTLQMFLTYAGYTDLRSWNELFTSLTPQLDSTVFAGFLAGVLSVAAIASPRDRHQRLFGGMVVLWLLLGAASPLATVTYYFWPLARLFRHLALLTTVGRFWCAFLAGATLDRMVGEAAYARRTALVAAVICASWLVILVLLAVDPVNLRAYLDAMATQLLPRLPPFEGAAAWSRLARAILFLGATLFLLAATWRSGRRSVLPSSIGWALALVLFADATSYGIIENLHRTIAMSKVEAAAFRFTDLPYQEVRSAATTTVLGPREHVLERVMNRLVGERYSSDALLWMNDAAETNERTVFWSTALDALLPPLAGRTGNEPAVAGGPLYLPANDPLARRITGTEPSKVRLFGAAVVCPDVESTARVLSSGAYEGQMALLTLGTDEKGNGIPPNSTTGLRVADCTPPSEFHPAAIANARAALMRFTSNSAAFTVTNPTGSPAVMTYSDAWSESWRGRVDDAPVAVYRSDIAYKAVLVPPGEHRVVFVYDDRLGHVVSMLDTLASWLFSAACAVGLALGAGSRLTTG